MGFIKPRLAEVEPGWADGRRSDRIRPMAQDWAEAGFGTPDAVLVLYALKIAKKESVVISSRKHT